jgi:hypothetical protein
MAGSVRSGGRVSTLAFARVTFGVRLLEVGNREPGKKDQVLTFNIFRSQLPE